MIVITDKLDKELYEVSEKLSKETPIEIVSQNDLKVVSESGLISLFTKGNTRLDESNKVLLLGNIDDNIIRLLKDSNYKGINSFEGTLAFSNEVDAVKNISRSFPLGFTKGYTYQLGKYKFDFIPTDIEKIFVTPFMEFNQKTEWIRTVLADKYNLYYYYVTIGRKGEKYFPLSIIPQINYEELGFENLLNEIKKFKGEL